MKILLIDILAIIFFASTVMTQQDSVYSITRSVSDDGKTFIHDAAHFMTSPVRFSSEDWMIAGTMIMSTVIVFNADEPMRHAMQFQHSSFNDRLAGIGNTYGEGLYGFGIAVGLYAGGMFASDDHIRKSGFILLESLAFATTISTAGKYIISRSRPVAEEGSVRFNGFRSDYAHTSFPSGHATVAFTVSSVLAEQIDIPAVTIGLYSLAIVTALARVYDDQHWLSDTFAGALLGTVCGLSVSRMHDSQEKKVSVNIFPTLNGIRSEIRF